MDAKNSTINLAVPVSGLEEWIQSRINEAIQQAGKVEAQLKEYVSQKELCQRLGLSTPTVIALRKKGIIEGVCIGNKWRFEVSEVWKSLRTHQEKQAKQFTPIKRNGRP
jgi:excisionase family DNA binding protein